MFSWLKEGDAAHLFSINHKINKQIMEIVETKDEKKLQINRLGETPFNFATDGERNYIISGRVLMETEESEEEVKTWLEQKPWAAISLLAQAIADEIINNNNKK